MKHEVASKLTKQAFANALKKKMSEKSLSKITVTELIEDCGLNRKTFYYHFEDLDALVKWVLKQEMLDIIKQFEVTFELEDLKNVICSIVSYIKQNHYICECMIHSIGYMDMKKMITKELKEPLSTFISKYAGDLDIPIEYREFLIDFYTEALSGILMSYVIKNADATSNLRLEKNIAYLNNFLKHTLQFALDEAEMITSI